MLKPGVVRTNRRAPCLEGIITIFALCFFMVLDLRLKIKTSKAVVMTALLVFMCFHGAWFAISGIMLIFAI